MAKLSEKKARKGPSHVVKSRNKLKNYGERPKKNENTCFVSICPTKFTNYIHCYLGKCNLPEHCPYTGKKNQGLVSL
jgi:hypothetical protein